jgi:azurin
MKRRLQHNPLWAVLILALSVIGTGPHAAAWAQDATTVTVEPEGNQLLFADTEFTVAPGQEVTIVFNNTATSAAMQHNVVVLDTMDDSVINRVGQAAIQAGPDKEYVPDDPSVLAYTPIAKPGETVEVTFTAPEEPGKYRYLCTFPGHYVTMQGTMIVEEDTP